MNFYQMDVDSIERHYRNTDQSIPDVLQALIDKLKEAELELEEEPDEIPVKGKGKEKEKEKEKGKG